jgi:hypothetical protein
VPKGLNDNLLIKSSKGQQNFSIWSDSDETMRVSLPSPNTYHYNQRLASRIDPAKTILSITLTPNPIFTPSPILTLGPIFALGSTIAVSSMKHGSMISGPFDFGALGDGEECAVTVGDRRRRSEGFV